MAACNLKFDIGIFTDIDCLLQFFNRPIQSYWQIPFGIYP